MQSSRDEVLALIRRWQSENSEISFEFCTVDHHLQIGSLPIYQARIRDADSFKLFQVDRNTDEASMHTVYVKLVPDEGYDICDVATEAHPTFRANVGWRTILRIPFGEFGDLYLFELEKHDLKKVM